MRTNVRALCLCLLLLAAPAVAARAQGASSNLTFLGGKDSFTVPFELVDNRIFVDVWLEGRGPFKFILDTGGYGGFSTEVAKEIGAKLGGEIQGRGAGESVVTAWETSVKETRLGGLVLKDQDYRVFDFSDARHVFGSQRFDGVIGLPVFSQAVVRVDYEGRRLTFTRPSKFSHRGGAILRQFTVTFDYTRRQLFFEKNRSYGRRDTYDRAGLWLSRSADGRAFEVYDVVARGPAAEAGLKAGDRVLRIDGRGVESLPLVEARSELKDARRKSVRLTVEDGARTREVVVRLRDLV